jgi:hypothetical protein
MVLSAIHHWGSLMNCSSKAEIEQLSRHIDAEFAKARREAEKRAERERQRKQERWSSFIDWLCVFIVGFGFGALAAQAV